MKDELEKREKRGFGGSSGQEGERRWAELCGGGGRRCVKVEG